jgi:fructokinase
MTLRLGVDIGGTKIEAAVVRTGRDDVDVIARRRVETRREAGYDRVVEATVNVVADVARSAGLEALPPVGVGMPGSVTFRLSGGGSNGRARSDEPLVKNSNTTCLNGRPFRGDLARALASKFPSFAAGSVAFANDANCFALAEAMYGAARGARVAFGVILGTGVGGGVVFRSGDEAHVWDGAQGIAGEWGHVTLDPAADLPCYCGRSGCVEQFLSGPAIERAYAARSGVAGVRRGVAEIAQRVGEDAAAAATIDGVVDAFGRGIATVIDILDPDVIVLGGGVSNLDVFYDRGPAAVLRWVFNDELRTRIVKHALGDSAGVIGAALLPSPSSGE